MFNSILDRWTFASIRATRKPATLLRKRNEHTRYKLRSLKRQTFKVADATREQQDQRRHIDNHRMSILELGMRSCLAIADVAHNRSFARVSVHCCCSLLCVCFSILNFAVVNSVAFHCRRHRWMVNCSKAVYSFDLSTFFLVHH